MQIHLSSGRTQKPPQPAVESNHQRRQPVPWHQAFNHPAAAWWVIVVLVVLAFTLPVRAQDPSLYNLKYPMDTNVSMGATVSFRVYATSTNPPMTFQWQHEGTNLPGATNYLLVLTNVTVAHAGGYMAWITNASGEFTNTRTAILTVDPTFIKITTGAIVTDREPSFRASWCDYDGDGFQDLFVANGSL